MIDFIKEFFKWEHTYKSKNKSLSNLPRISTLFMITAVLWNWTSILLVYLPVTRAGWVIANFVLTIVVLGYIYYDVGGVLNAKSIEVSEDTLRNLPEKDTKGESDLLLEERESESTIDSSDTSSNILHNSESEESNDDNDGTVISTDWGNSNGGFNSSELELDLGDSRSSRDSNDSGNSGDSGDEDGI